MLVGELPLGWDRCRSVSIHAPTPSSGLRWIEFRNGSLQSLLVMWPDCSPTGTLSPSAPGRSLSLPSPSASSTASTPRTPARGAGSMRPARSAMTPSPCRSGPPPSTRGRRIGIPAVPEYAASRTSRGTAAEPTSQKLTMTRGARGPAPAGATWRPGAGLGVSRCAHRASDTGMDPCHRPQAGARDPRRAARPTVHRPGHRRRTPRRRAQRATLDPQLRAVAADARPPDRDLPPTQHNLTGHRRLHRR